MGTKPMLSFAGDAWENELELKDGSKIDFKRIRNLFVDFFRGDTVNNVRRTGLELLMQFTLQEGKNLVLSTKNRLIDLGWAPTGQKK